MRQSVRVISTGTFAWALLALLPYAISPAHAQEIHLNSSKVQVIHNTTANTDVLNMSLNVTSDGEYGACDGEKDDLLETGVDVELSGLTCEQFYCFYYWFGFYPASEFEVDVNYVEHTIGNTSYGTSFAAYGGSSVSSRIDPVATPAYTCGTWNIKLQAKGQNLTNVTSSPVALFLNDSDDSGPFCFNVYPQIGNGIAPSNALHRIR